MPRLQSLALVLAFALNPMIVYYAVNGMSEMPYLFFLTLRHLRVRHVVPDGASRAT